MIFTKMTTSLKTNLNKAYWESRYQQSQTGWDIGYAAPALIEYANQLPSKDLRILIPGAGFGHEAQALLNEGFNNITVIDLSGAALQDLQKRIPATDCLKMIEGDFFEHLGTYDLILEQTFFCALDPKLRPKYASHAYNLLASGGKLAGLFFDFPLSDQGPPFGGSAKEYRDLFSEYFHIKTLERSYNSIKPRAGKELFAIFEKSETFNNSL